MNVELEMFCSRISSFSLESVLQVLLFEVCLELIVGVRRVVPRTDEVRSMALAYT